MKNLLLIFLATCSLSCTKKSARSDATHANAETSMEQISNKSDLLFGEAEGLFRAGKKSEAAQKLSIGIDELKNELRKTAGVTTNRIDSVSFFLEELVLGLEDGTKNITEIQLVTALYRAQLMAAHDYLVFTAQHIDNNELDSAQVSIIHATSRMINGIDKVEGEHKTTLQKIHAETETLLNDLETQFQKDVTQIRHRLEKLRLQIKELENHIKGV